MKDKVVVITGASSGIGRATAIHFARQQSKLVIAARTEDKLKEVANEIVKITPNVLCLTLDVSKEEDCKKLIDKGIEKFGKIDVLINNAGISMRAMFDDIDLEVFKQVMDINYWGSIFTTKSALSSIMETKGTIVGISSIAGYKGLPGRVAYSSSKFALQGFLESLRIELLNTGVNVMWVSPGFTASNIRNTALAADGSAQGGASHRP